MTGRKETILRYAFFFAGIVFLLVTLLSLILGWIRLKDWIVFRNPLVVAYTDTLSILWMLLPLAVHSAIAIVFLKNRCFGQRATSSKQREDPFRKARMRLLVRPYAACLITADILLSLLLLGMSLIPRTELRSDQSVMQQGVTAQKEIRLDQGASIRLSIGTLPPAYFRGERTVLHVYTTMQDGRQYGWEASDFRDVETMIRYVSDSKGRIIASGGEFLEEWTKNKTISVEQHEFLKRMFER